MTAIIDDARRRIPSLLGPDRPIDLALVVATFATFAVLDRSTRALAGTEIGDLTRASISLAAVERRWWLALVLMVAGAMVAAYRPDRVLVRWTDLEDGRALRWLAGAVVVLVTWQAALYHYNWLAGRSHWIDRVLVLTLAGAALARPAFLVPFVAVSRMVVEQLVLPFGTTAARNIDDVLLMVLLALAAGHLVGAVTGTRRTAAALLVASSALAAHFFVPGRGKLAIGWLEAGRIADLPLAAYTAGWQGQGDGGWSRALSGFYDRFQWPVMAATLVLELGALVAVTRPRLFRWWLPGAIGFHLVTFATTGFWFVTWIVFEVGLLAVLGWRAVRPVALRNATPARGLLAALAVLAGPLLFHPPGLAWLDGPVSYGYRIEAVGVSGDRYTVPINRLEPLDHHAAFKRLDLGGRPHASGAYGAVATSADLARLEPIGTFAELATEEATRPAPVGEDESTAFLMSFLDYAGRPRQSWPERLNRALAPPPHFWTGAPEPTWDVDEPLTRLEVLLMRSIHHEGEPEYERELVLVVRVDADGRIVVEKPADDVG